MNKLESCDVPGREWETEPRLSAHSSFLDRRQNSECWRSEKSNAEGFGQGPKLALLVLIGDLVLVKSVNIDVLLDRDLVVNAENRAGRADIIPEAVRDDGLAPN